MLEKTVRFLHIADIHLGCRQYNEKTREKDFFLAFESAIEKYALPLEEGGKPQVDFVILAGDLFDSRNIQPLTLSRATHVMELLKAADIPLFAIEGNHDQTRRGELANWYNYLSDGGLMIYLRDFHEGGKLKLLPWDGAEGSYYDHSSGIRIIGSSWYGATAHTMLERFPEVLKELPPAAFSIMMFHGGLTDYVSELSAGVDYEQFLKLREYIDYLALGHVHKAYQRQNWLFNPGSLESCTIREYFEENGSFRIEVGPEGVQKVEHCVGHRKRPFIVLSIECDSFENPSELEEGLKAKIKTEGRAALSKIRSNHPPDIEELSPVFSLEFRGSLGFPFSQLPLKELTPWIKETLSAELIRFRNDTVPLEYGHGDEYLERDGRFDREKLEEHVFKSFFHQDTRYRSQSSSLAHYAKSLKKRLLEENLEENELDALLSNLKGILEQLQPLPFVQNDSPETGSGEKDQSSILREKGQSRQVNFAPEEQKTGKTASN